jgi:hypothetical protein
MTKNPLASHNSSQHLTLLNICLKLEYRKANNLTA